MVDAIEKAAMNFAAARRKLKAKAPVDKARKSTKKREKELIGQTDRRHLKRSGRTDVWAIRMRPELKAQCKAKAESKGMLLSAWAEAAFEAFLAAEGTPHA